MRDAGPDIQFRLRHSERVRHYCEADSYIATGPGSQEIKLVWSDSKVRSGS